ncbi:MAG: aldehyde dehydrogenase family protein, partial [candidate division NC10 bacterium]
MPAGQLFIGGAWRAPVSGETYTTINPANEEPSAEVGKGDERDLDLAVAAARKAFDQGPWPRMSAADRGRIVWKLGDLIQQNLDEMARLESLNTGKTMFDSGKVEIPFAAEVFRYYAGWATKIHGETLALRDNAFTFTLRQPVGVVGAIVPWNFPFLLSSWKIAPALAAGNTVILKPASLTPLTALKFAELCQQAGLPEGVFNVVTGPGGTVGMGMVRDPRVDKIAFTGSTDVGKQIMREAAGTLKRLSLELGGKSPNIVFADADLDAAVKGAMTGIFYNKGEVCAAGSRLFVEEKIHAEFMAQLTEKVKGLKVGDPMDKATRMGPVVSRQQMETVLGYIEAGKRDGARLVAGGGRANIGTGKGFFIEPTI